MGTEAGKAIRARQRESAARVERLIRRRDERTLIGSARQQRIKAAAREGRLALRVLAKAEQSVGSAEERVGRALRQMVEEGLPRSDAYAALDLTRAVGDRLIGLAERAQRRTGAGVSTDVGSDRDIGAVSAHGETGVPEPGGALKEGSL